MKRQRQPFTAPVRRGLAILLTRGEGSFSADASYGHTTKADEADVDKALAWATGAGVYDQEAER